MKKTDQVRKSRIAAIHMGKAALGMDDDTYRDFLENITGQRSAKDCSNAQLLDVIKALDAKGFSKEKKEFGQKPDVAKEKQAMMGKIEALLADAGLHWNYAVGIAKKMFFKEALEFCTQNELHRIIAALEYQKKRRLNDGDKGRVP